MEQNISRKNIVLQLMSKNHIITNVLITNVYRMGIIQKQALSIKEYPLICPAHTVKLGNIHYSQVTVRSQPQLHLSHNNSPEIHFGLDCATWYPWDGLILNPDHNPYLNLILSVTLPILNVNFKWAWEVPRIPDSTDHSRIAPKQDGRQNKKANVMWLNLVYNKASVTSTALVPSNSFGPASMFCMKLLKG
jgi:hypothetical protein